MIRFALLSILAAGYLPCDLQAQEVLSFRETFQQDLYAPYRVFETTNINTLIAISTQTGQVYQIHPGIGENSTQGVITINNKNLAPDLPEEINRFTLYPTQNIFSFLLVDQLRGKFWRVQWSYEADKRFIQLLPFLKE